MTRRHWGNAAAIAALALAVGLVVAQPGAGTSPAAPAIEVSDYTVELPWPYKREDGTALPYNEFKHTVLVWGDCVKDSGATVPARGEAIVPSHRPRGTLRDVPVRQWVCFQAVVIGLDGAEMGRSHVVAVPPPTRPRSPITLRI